MFGSFRLGTILGIPVAANWSVLLIAGLIAWSLADRLLPAQVPDLVPAVYWLFGVFAAGFFLVSLLAHELAHAIVARREGLTVSGITLWLLGGVARMGGEASTPGAEARIAGVGPLTSFVLALAFAGATIAATAMPQIELVALAAASASWLAIVNLVLAVFNLLPGAPLDGGRIARALVWRFSHDKRRATRWATGIGQLLGYGLIGIGLFRTFAGDLGGFWFVLLGFFLNGAAATERQSTELLESLRGVRVGEIMDRQPLRVPAGLTVDTFAAAAHETRASSWLVTGPGGSVVGILGAEALRSVRGGDARSRRIGELAKPLDHWPVAYEDELVTEVVERLGGSQARAVVRGPDDPISEVRGLLSAEDITHAVARFDAAGDREGKRATHGDDPNEGRVLP